MWLRRLFGAENLPKFSSLAVKLYIPLELLETPSGKIWHKCLQQYMDSLNFVQVVSRKLYT